MGFESEMMVVLGGTSPHKAGVLQEAGLPFEMKAVSIDEQSIRNPDPMTLTRWLAIAKNEAGRAGLAPNRVLVTSDVVLVFQGRVREKPRDAAEARRWLHEYAGKTIECVAGVCVYSSGNGLSANGCERSAVEFAPSLVDAVEDIIDEGTALQCCGAVVFEIPPVAKHVTRTYRPQAEWLKAHLYGPEARAVSEELATSSAIKGLPLQMTYHLMSLIGVRNFLPST